MQLANYYSKVALPLVNFSFHSNLFCDMSRHLKFFRAQGEMFTVFISAS